VIDRRQFLIGSGAGFAASACATWHDPLSAAFQSPFDRTALSVAAFGAPADSSIDATRAVQAAIREVERGGGGTVVIPGRYRCGNIVISGENVRLQGQGGWLVDGRLTIAPRASNIEIADLGLIDTRGDRTSFLMDVSGRNCRFTNLQLVKDPATGGYQMYIRQQAAGCQFQGLTMRGSNGIMVAGSGHTFDGFDFQAQMLPGSGGDDGFAIKAAVGVTENITIGNGTLRGYGAMVSFGSEIGTSKPGGQPGAVRNVTVENVTGDRCTRIAFFKPGALDYDYRNGIIEHIVLSNVSLNDPAGVYFRTGIYMIAARGAVIRDVQASGIKINARAMDSGVAPTSAIDIQLLDKGAPATIEDVNLQVAFTDPYSGAPHSSNAPGYPVDYIVRIEKRNPGSGTMSGIVLDVEGRGARIGGMFVGEGLDGAISVPRAVLTRVATDPPAANGGGGIWSNSRLNLGDIQLDSVKLPKFGGRAFGRPHN
jgi:hypothetical protein